MDPYPTRLRALGAALVLLQLLLGLPPTAAQTQSPTIAPTAAPTPIPTMSPTFVINYFTVYNMVAYEREVWLALQMTTNGNAWCYPRPYSVKGPAPNGTFIKANGYREYLNDGEGYVQLYVRTSMPLTNWNIWCYTEDAAGTPLPDADIAASVFNITTRCCYDYFPQQLPPEGLYTGYSTDDLTLQVSPGLRQGMLVHSRCWRAWVRV
jgi:hypothetical protein